MNPNSAHMPIRTDEIEIASVSFSVYLLIFFPQYPFAVPVRSEIVRKKYPDIFRLTFHQMTINDRSAIALRPPFDWYGSKDYTICARQKAFALLLMIELI